MALPSSWLNLGQKLASSLRKDPSDINNNGEKSPKNLKKRSLANSPSHEKTKIIKKKKIESLLPISSEIAIGSSQDLVKYETLERLERKKHKDHKEKSKKNKKDKKHKRRLDDYLSGKNDIFDNVPEGFLMVKEDPLPREAGLVYNVKLKSNLLGVSLMRFGDENIRENGLRSDTVPRYRRLGYNLIVGLVSDKGTELL